LFFSKHGSREEFKQSELDWIVGQSMKKKIFALLLRSGWITKSSKDSYRCTSPENVMNGLFEFKLPTIIKEAKKGYAFTGLSAVEIWSDFSYVQRSRERSPYFIKVLKKDLTYWKEFFNRHRIPYYINQGSTIGEYAILIPVQAITNEEKDGIKVETLKETLRLSKSNDMHLYAYDYIKKRYGTAATQRA